MLGTDTLFDHIANIHLSTPYFIEIHRVVM